MIKVYLNFYKNIFNLKKGVRGFHHQIEIEELPEEDDFFDYTEEFFSQMDKDAQNHFSNNYGFKTGEFYVKSIMDYRWITETSPRTLII